MPIPLPQTAHAIQLTGPDTLVHNPAKPVPVPGPHQILCKVEAVSLCFSDLKLLHRFAAHPRKGEIKSGIAPEVLKEIPSYVPGEAPTVPGHEAAVRIVAAGPKTRHPVGLRALVETDYRWLPTEGNNAAFGYNFEGALQEYVLMDERVIISPEGESFLLPVGEDLSASSVGLIEPWACVESAYAMPERTAARPGGKMLVVAEPGHAILGVEEVFSPKGPPAWATCVVAGPAQFSIRGCRVEVLHSLDDLAGKSFDDILYFGARRETIEKLDGMFASRGLLNIVLGGEKIGEPVAVDLGRIHYSGIRIIGTTGHRAGDSLRRIPPTPEIRPGEKILIVGAAGPMGAMHVIRALSLGVPDVEVAAADLDEARLALLDTKAVPLAKKNGLRYQSFNPAKHLAPDPASYVALMVPKGHLAARAVEDVLPGGIINIFAGIPAGVRQEIALDQYIEKGLYFTGASGSTLRDMKIVLERVAAGTLDPDWSVAAISGMKGAIAGLLAVEARAIPGKIVVYPALHDLDLIPLDDLAEKLPAVHAKLNDGRWNAEAEKELLRETKADSREWR